ncbi:MAG TPA: glycerophosphodiester phosphodiesterase family protein [Jatrophihabitans sp.]|nr:glycerophosphodiester phosphodiesterase family protein [Jatrophihabitans sp.]
MRYCDRPGPLAIAHRGGAGLAPENTMEAFRRSYHLGFRYLETDVRLTSDRQLVAFHDARLNRVTGASGPLRARTLVELTGLPALGGGPVQSLPALLAMFPRACFTLDVKHPAVIAPLAGLLNAGNLTSRICVAGARGRWLRELRARVGPELCTALSWRELGHLASRARGRYGEAAFAHIPLRLGRIPVFRDDLVARAHDAGIRAVVWTVNEPAIMHRLLDHGVDGIITDRPDLLREVLVARGQWHAPDGRIAAVT